MPAETSIMERIKNDNASIKNQDYLRRSTRPPKKRKPFTPDPTPPDETNKEKVDVISPTKKVIVTIPSSSTEMIQSLENTPKKNIPVAEQLIANLGKSKSLFHFISA